MKTFKVTKKWLEERDACPRLKQRFLKKYPKGLTVSRRNIYKVVKELPIRALTWFVYQLEVRNSISSTKVLDLWDMIDTPSGRFTSSPIKKHAYAKALADVLKL